MASLPAQIGRYEIKSLIGRGGMGDLYLAHDPNTNRLVAIKLLNATLDSTELRERFAREAHALAALSHPNIVNIYDSGEFEDSPFIVMEYVRGETLDELIKRRAALSVSQKLKLMAELCAGLAQAHEAGIIHRDIKPANLMVDQQGHLKILDFGIARVAEGSKTRVGMPLTQVNMMIGTPGYMSPEQIEGGDVDHRSDIFAVGAVCYELLSYDEAFSGDDTRQVERNVLQAQPKPLGGRVPGLDPEIDEVVLRAMKRDPNKRYQDAATFERALERIRARMSSEVQPQAPPRRPTPPSPQNARARAHEARAEAAYQRALAAHKGGALEAARRFAVEALAEDPSHANARTFLARLEPRAPVPPTAQSAGALPPTVLSTSVGRSDTAAGGSGTAVGGASQTIASAPTIIVTPGANAGAKPRAAQRRYEPPSKGIAEQKKPDAPSRRREPPLWTKFPALWARYRWPIVVGAALLVAVLLVLVVVRLFVLRPSGQLLTISKPSGGTISATGITCGTRGNDCASERPSGDAIELRPEADSGFTFVGYTGDCAPGGRTLMNGPRTCGAKFDAVTTTAAPSTATQTLTIAPVPTGGTLEGVDIICGTKGSVCSANHPEGVPVELHPTADAGYTFMGFTGDCAPLGHTQMTAPRTCSATFSSTAAVAAATTSTIPRTSAGRNSVAGRGTSGAPSGDAAPAATTVSRGSSAPAGPPPPPASGRSGGATPAASSPPPAATPQGPVPLPPTDEQYAKGKIQELLKDYCGAYEAMDTAAVQRLYPKVNMQALKMQLNQSKYRSVQCTFGEPTYLALDAVGGTAKVRADVKQVFEHTILTEKPQKPELTATLSLIRPGPRTPWQIETAEFRLKEK